jgi:hypothetical protein
MATYRAFVPVLGVDTILADNDRLLDRYRPSFPNLFLARTRLVERGGASSSASSMFSGKSTGSWLPGAVACPSVDSSGIFPIPNSTGSGLASGGGGDVAERQPEQGSGRMECRPSAGMREALLPVARRRSGGASACPGGKRFLTFLANTPFSIPSFQMVSAA